MAFAGKVTATLVLSLTLLPGCRKQEETAPARAIPASPHLQGTVKKPTTVLVPSFVEGKWKAVKIAFTDKRSGSEAVYAVPVGGSFAIPGSDVSIRVDSFLPHFTMEGTTLTSQSNRPENPAAQVIVLEDGNQIFKGWLFARFPTTHAFQHPRYGFKLVGYVPAT
jgi:hypothetical protein